MAEQEILNHISSTQEQVSQLREDATTTARNIIKEVKGKYVSRTELDQFSKNFSAELEKYLNNKLIEFQQQLIAQIMPRDKGKEPETGSNSGSTQYDADDDVIMKSKFVAPLNQAPDAELFDGDSTKTELFCDICKATFNFFPYSSLPETVKIDYVKLRLRGSARSWYQFKHPEGQEPFTLDLLLDEIRAAFPNVLSQKLAKIQILKLRQQFGKVKDYIEEFRNLSSRVNLEEKSLTLLFYNGLHPKIQHQINKLEVLPESLEDMITKCIVYENNMAVTQKLNNNKSSNKQLNHKKSKKHFKNNKSNYNNNYQNFNNKNATSIDINKIQKINSKN